MNYKVYKAYYESIKTKKEKVSSLEKDLEECNILIDTILDSVYEDTKTLSRLLESLRNNTLSKEEKEKAKTILKDIVVVKKDYDELNLKKQEIIEKLREMHGINTLTGNSVNKNRDESNTKIMSKRPISRLPKRI